MEQSNPNSIASTTPLNLCDQHYQNHMKTFLLAEKFSKRDLLEWPLKVNFLGWYKLHQSWGEWIEKLSLRHAKTWELTGICDGILSSLHEIKPNPDIVLGLCEFWCSKTNTFIFPWGEATITLEDVCILAGFSVFGEPVNLPISEDSGKILEQKLHRVRRTMFMKNVDRSASYTSWFKHFNVQSGDFEHVGFLAFWLSRFVFPDLDDINVGKHVFPTAVNLTRGVKIALAPAVLACLYNNLSFLTKHAADFDSYKREISLPGAFHIVQLWALERLPLLGSKLAKPLNLGQPRIARWDKVSSEIKLVDVRSVLRKSDGFCRRPYSLDLENWRPRTVCLKNGKIVSGCLNDDDELKSFRVFVQAQELIGIDCSAMYFPQRVAIQFECEREGAFKISPCLESKHINACNKSMSGNRNVIHEGLEQKACLDDKKPVPEVCDTTKSDLVCIDDSLPKAMATTAEVEILNASSIKDGSKRDYWKGTLVVLRNKNHANKVKRKFGDSADYPLYVVDHIGRARNRVKRSGISIEHPIDVENYYHYSD